MKNTVLETMLETLDEFEEHAGVRLAALSVVLVDYEDQGLHPDLRILGEVHARGGTALTRPVRIAASAYDSSGRLVDMGETYIDSENFFGFEIFEICLSSLPTNSFSKIRVVPRVSE